MTAPAPKKRESIVGEINTLLGRGSEFEGKLTFEGTVRIDGKLKGEVFSEDTLVVGEGATVEAEVEIGEIIIQGTVIGTSGRLAALRSMLRDASGATLPPPNCRSNAGSSLRDARSWRVLRRRYERLNLRHPNRPHPSRPHQSQPPSSLRLFRGVEHLSNGWATILLPPYCR